MEEMNESGDFMTDLLKFNKMLGERDYNFNTSIKNTGEEEEPPLPDEFKVARKLVFRNRGGQVVYMQLTIAYVLHM